MQIKEDMHMRKIIIAGAAALTMGAFALPAFADEVIVDGPSYDQGDQGYRHHRHHPGVTISDQGISVGSVRDRDRYDRHDDRGRCMTKSVTRTDENGDRVTKTMRRCD
jgi:hypothetical protein